MQHVRVIKDRNGNIQTYEESVGSRKYYFEELMKEENQRERRMA